MTAVSLCESLGEASLTLNTVYVRGEPGGRGRRPWGIGYEGGRCPETALGRFTDAFTDAFTGRPGDDRRTFGRLPERVVDGLTARGRG
ncbi:hypothetical protein OK074_4280 [Actinobacteria bacterium OK074]|nr:hypothetical protein OK074_4280 [Actinobacteria bacterium OK074]